MNQVKQISSDLPQPLRAVDSGLRRLPGAAQVSKVADSALDWLGTISPRGRRMAVYTGAGALGIAGVVEWPVALTGAAVAWLTQPHPRHDEHPPGDMTQGGRPPAAATPGPAPGETTNTEPYGPSDRLASSHFHQERPGTHPNEQPAKVGDPATASALKQVAEATVHPSEPDPAHEAPQQPA